MKELIEIKAKSKSVFAELSYNEKSRHLCILVHGFKGFYKWGFFQHIKNRLLARGIACLAFNFSHNGVRRHGNEINDFYKFRSNTFLKELDDFDLVKNYIFSEKFIFRFEKLFSIAHSRGAFTTLLYASEYPDLFDKIVSLAGVSHYVDRYPKSVLEEYKKAGYAEFVNGRTGDILKVDYSFQREIEENKSRFDLLNHIRKINSGILLLHGDKDETIHVSELNLLYNGSEKSKTGYKIIKNAGHTFNYDRVKGVVNPELNEAINSGLSFLLDN